MKRTIMSYMVATIVSLAAVGGLTMQPIPSMAQTATSQNSTTQSQVPIVNAACGEVVQGVVNLTSNLKCTGDGLIIGSDQTVVSLNGYTIEGPGQGSSKVGIMVPNVDGAVIQGPGVVQNFQAGILVTGGSGLKVSSLILTGNQIAVFMTGSKDVKVEENIMKNNGLGVATHSTNSPSIISNLINSNALAGATLVNTHKGIVAGNNIDGAQNGIFIDAQSSDNTVQMNNAMNNLIDIDNANGLPPNINNNVFKDNNCQTSQPSGLCIGR